MFHNRIAEFKGAGSLPDAALTLMNDLRLDMAVVRGVSQAIPELKHKWEREPSKTDFLQAAYDAIPNLEALDQAVTSYWDKQHEYHDYPILPNIRNAFVNIGGAYPHVDSENIGPISLSLRVDASFNRRLFYARRTPRATLTPEGLDIPAYHEASDPHMYYFKHRATKVKQNPGDVVIIPNQPHPAVHAVKSREFATAALIMHYGFADHVKYKQIANKTIAR